MGINTEKDAVFWRATMMYEGQWQDAPTDACWAEEVLNSESCLAAYCCYALFKTRSDAIDAAEKSMNEPEDSYEVAPLSLEEAENQFYDCEEGFLSRLILEENLSFFKALDKINFKN